MFVSGKNWNKTRFAKDLTKKLFDYQDNNRKKISLHLQQKNSTEKPWNRKYKENKADEL